MAHIQTESEWELEMCGKIVDYLAGKIYVDMRFMEPVLNVLVPRANMGLSTFATDGVYLYMNTRHTMDVFRKNENFLVRMYLHSVLHCVYSIYGCVMEEMRICGILRAILLLRE